MDIRILSTMEELRLVKGLEDTIWVGDSIPTHQTVTAVKNGGLMLGAFIDEELVGFSYSFPGYLNGEVFLCSHNMGIHSNYRGKGIGSKLKFFQREAARKMGYNRITWTYDPLETRNGFLNLSKLGATCNTYIENCYGEVEDGLNNGLPTDRFQVEWWTNQDYESGLNKMAKLPAAKKLIWKEMSNGLPTLEDVFSIDHYPHIQIPVPADIQHMKKIDPTLALDWRMKTRSIFQSLFNKGYSAVAVEKSEHELVHYYMLIHQLAKEKEL